MKLEKGSGLPFKSNMKRKYQRFGEFSPVICYLEDIVYDSLLWSPNVECTSVDVGHSWQCVVQYNRPVAFHFDIRSFNRQLSHISQHNHCRLVDWLVG